MFTINDFTDPQGVTHPTAVFMIRSANLRVDKSETLQMNMNDHTADPVLNEHESSYVSYQLCYFPMEDTSGTPYCLTNEGLDVNFHANLTELGGYEGLSVADAVEKHFREVVAAV